MNGIENAIDASGGILYLMALLLFVALTVVIERGWFLWTTLQKGKQVMTEVEDTPHLDVTKLKQLDQQFPTLPHAYVMKVALQHDVAHDFEHFADKLDESIMKAAPKVDRYLWMLDTIVTMAPLIGLLGTIIGMFNAFHVLGNAGGAPTRITGGVAEALVATASGLLIAIIGLFFFNNLNNQARGVMHQMETLKLMLINRMYLHYQKNDEEISPLKQTLGSPL